MVKNNTNLSAYSGAVPPMVAQGQRLIGNEPLYDGQEVLTLLEVGAQVLIPWTRKCEADLQRFSMDHDDALALIREAITHGKYRDSEWCEQKPSGPWAACDAYQLHRQEWVEKAHKYFSYEYYVKFAIGKTGKLLLLVSCHLSEDRG